MADVVIRNDRMKIRVVGIKEYFDEGIIKSIRCSHFVPPARYKRPKLEVAPNRDKDINEDLYADFKWPTWIRME